MQRVNKHHDFKNLETYDTPRTSPRTTMPDIFIFLRETTHMILLNSTPPSIWFAPFPLLQKL